MILTDDISSSSSKDGQTEADEEDQISISVLIIDEIHVRVDCIEHLNRTGMQNIGNIYELPKAIAHM
jgi:hypothetical protein